MRVSYFFDYIRACMFDRHLYFQHHSGPYTMQEPSSLGKIVQVSVWFRMFLWTPIITRVYKDSLTLTYPPNIKIWLVLQFQYPQVNTLIPLLMMIIDTTNSPIHQSNIGFVQIFLLTLDKWCSWRCAPFMLQTLLGLQQPCWSVLPAPITTFVSKIYKGSVLIDWNLVHVL